VELLAAADVQSILKQIPKGKPDEQLLLQRTGFLNAKYAVWEYADVTGRSPSHAELSFVGPRTGVASWLAAPAHLTGLDFASPDAAMVMSVLLKNPAEIFAEIKSITDSPNSKGSQQLASMEPVLMPILSQLTGNITLELDTFPPAAPVWKVILGARDVNALQQSLSPLLAGMRARTTVVDGETYYLVQVPNGTKPMEVSYSFQQGALVVGSSLEAVVKAESAHRTGKSLGTSQKFLASLPPEHSSDASAVMYQNSMGLLNTMMSNLPPEISRGWLQASNQNLSSVSALYGEESVIRQASRSGASAVAPTLIVAAIAIPNLLRSRIAANEASAVGSLRSLYTAQVVYATEYPDRGFARDLASLGPAGRGIKQSAAHAGLLDEVLGCAGGTSGNWCTKSGYKFTIQANCTQRCSQFVSLATPVSTSTGARNFCSTMRGRIHIKVGPPLTSTITAAECESWEVLR
jgi:hypothetical protein